jgi:hypothetical protein
MMVFKAYLRGETPEDIFNDNPGLFSRVTDISQDFNRLINSNEAKEISDLISQSYGIDFQLSDIVHKDLKQITSMPEKERETPEKSEAKKKLHNAIRKIPNEKGEPSEFKGNLDVVKITRQAQKHGLHDELADVLKFNKEYKMAQEKEERERDYGAFFEDVDVDVDKLMERVYKRLQGK